MNMKHALYFFCQTCKIDLLGCFVIVYLRDINFYIEVQNVHCFLSAMLHFLIFLLNKRMFLYLILFYCYVNCNLSLLLTKFTRDYF